MTDNIGLLELAIGVQKLRQKLTEAVGKEFGLPSLEVDIIMFIYLRREESTATEIGKGRDIKKNTISIHVENLVRSGFLERQERQGDRRQVRLSLTDKAIAVAERCVAEGRALGKELRAGLSEEEIATLKHCFEVINENALKLSDK